MGRWTVVGLVLYAVVAGVLLTGCGGPDVVFVADGAGYTFEQVEALHTSQRPPSSMAGEPVDTASDLRRDALVELRAQGGEAAELADFVTSALADTGRSVLYYGEAADVEGSPAWVLLEAWGAQSGTLDSTRLWVFDRESGAVIYSSTSR